MANQIHDLLSVLVFLFLALRSEPLLAKEVVPVGVVLDLKSPVGELAEICMSMAISDFYAVHDNYSTRLALLTKDSGDEVVAAASAALDLMKNEEVQAIIGPQRSAQARFVIELGSKAQVPIISFSATSPSLSPAQNPFFIRTAQDDAAQVKAIADIVKAYDWREIVPIYEDTDYGNGLIPYLVDAFQEIDTRVPYRSVISPSSSNSEITNELKNLQANHTTIRIFVVHMTAALGSKLFMLAKNVGMMREGYAWIVTEGLSALVDPMGSKVMDSMQGVVGIRPYIPMSRDFERRLARGLTSSKANSKSTGLNVFGLWAYDTVCALAIAVEKAGIVHSRFIKKNSSQNNVDLAALGISEMGPMLRNAILATKFQGLSGKFHLVKGQLEPSTFEIFNVVGHTERIIGYWTRQRGLSRELDDSTSELAHSTLKDKLKQPIWPGDTTDQPKKLRIGVPKKKGFDEFLKVVWPGDNNNINLSGFCYDVFLAVQHVLPFPLFYEFVPFVNHDKESNGTYDQLLEQIKLQNYDAVVGDTTIVANRSSYVDFTLPYTESGVSMVVLLKDNEKKNFWIFLKPLSLDLWLATFIAFVFTGLVIWILEHRVNSEFRGPPGQQLAMILWFSFSTLVFAQRERVVSNLSKLVMIIWIFVVLILTQSYTASLASMLTVQRLQPSFVDVKEITRNGYYVGYQNGSFVKDLLIKQLNLEESKLKPYNTLEEYREALLNGSENGGVAAIFDEIPYIKLFLAKHCSKYTMVGPTYKTAGFGFAFPQGSPLVPYISRAILNVTENKEKFEQIERKYFSSQTSCTDQSATFPTDSPSLGVSSFRGLFVISGVASMFSLLVYVSKFLQTHWPALSTTNTERSFWAKVVQMAKYFDQKDLAHGSVKHPVDVPESSPDSHHMESENHSIGNSNVTRNDNERPSPPRHGDAPLPGVRI